jgi:hypothetical protein
LDPADLAAGANSLLPDDPSAVIRIKRSEDPGFLPRDQDALAIGKIGEHGR